MRTRKTPLAILAALVSLSVLPACEDRSDFEDAGEQADEALEEVGDEMDDAGDEIEDEIDDHTDGN